jgi:hypothetical protein
MTSATTCLTSIQKNQDLYTLKNLPTKSLISREEAWKLWWESWQPELSLYGEEYLCSILHQRTDRGLRQRNLERVERQRIKWLSSFWLHIQRIPMLLYSWDYWLTGKNYAGCLGNTTIHFCSVWVLNTVIHCYSATVYQFFSLHSSFIQ